MWTGDNTPHDIWQQSVEKNTVYTKKITEFINEHAPDIPVIAALGNHEFYPVNVMSFNEYDAVLEDITAVWDDYLDKEAQEKFREAGFYSMKVPIDSPEWKDVRVISMNSEQCNNMNWYLWS